MRRISHITMVAVLASCGVAQAGPVLLATIANTWHSGEPGTVTEYLAGDRMLYVTVGEARSGDLFEDTRVLIRRDGPPVTLSESATVATDPDFAIIAELLTDGVSLGRPDGTGLQEISVLGMIGGEELIDVHVPRFSDFDLFGYQIERIDREVRFSLASPFGDPSAPGTEFRIGGAYEIWGSVVPEPATFALLLVGSAVLFRRRRTKGRNSIDEVDPTRSGRHTRSPAQLRILVTGVALVYLTGAVRADFAAKNRPNWSLWRTGTQCPTACPPYESNTAADLFVLGLTEASGNVTIVVQPFADVSDNVDSGNGVWILRCLHRWNTHDFLCIRARLRCAV